MNNSVTNRRHILIVDDEPLVRHSLKEFLTFEGYTVSAASNGKEAIELLKNYSVDVMITDIKMPEMDGMQLLNQAKKISPGIPVILITSYGSIENAVKAMREGAYDYITKPIVDSEIKIIIERLMQQRCLFEENQDLKGRLSSLARNSFLNIVGQDEKMQKIYTLIEAIASTRASVLIHGESGTGKRLVAHAIHNCDKVEAAKPFVEVSCGALTETLLESELFGHVRGAFTGAIKDKPGRFELASDGTIFLDEIDAFSPALQVKLLRVLQDGEFERVGDNLTRKIDVRVIAATNQNLKELIAKGKFRTDLYYRLNIITIEIPPLRERKSDIPFLAEDFIKKHSNHIRGKIEGISSGAMDLLMRYGWPGNVRELENVVERAIILTKNQVIGPEDLPDILHSIQKDESAAPPAHDSVNGEVNGNGNLKLRHALKDPEKDLILKALNSVNWNRNKAAQLLGINRTTLYKKMRTYGLLKNGVESTIDS